MDDIKSENAFNQCVGKEITKLNLDVEGNFLYFEFDGGLQLFVSDMGQSCCESRYMRTDDDLMYYVGGKLLGKEIRLVAPIEDYHEIAFLVIKTSKGQFTMSNHNEHNGYYGGIDIVCSNSRD
jgi:hypothetical protein